MTSVGSGLLICDCDGVLVDTEHLVASVMSDVLAEWLDAEQVERALACGFGKQIEQIMDELAEQTELPVNSVELINQRVNTVLAAADIAIPGIRAALAAVSLPVAVVSNSHTDRLRLSIDAAGLAPLIRDHYFSADLVGRPKPFPDVYLHASEVMGVPPQGCLVIEDSLAGATAALAAGMTVWGFVGGSHIPPGHAAALRQLGVAGVFDDMSALPALVQQFAGGLKTRQQMMLKQK
ncbi:HAD-IA family hydrolase [Pokkaliibacter sp. MBI-7]|uniref:HAD family hydrolase n=1 Tax=Pokkaliibacter sp. MBI-7 TaxID=3040600 RepID=UPI00244A2C30|nr:HAD-IA family hydrolase [Pokkaliibacter sp. MBI-7]MDH2435517.1 HAD-IA family hydrolase [Pokkaliibacter sp. MBI-7]